jgi:hypothetical protein
VANDRKQETGAGTMRTFLNQFSWAGLVRSNVETILALHDGFLDDSWGNDICPKIIFGDDLIVWVDHPNPDKPQFTVEENSVDRETSETFPTVVLETDSFDETVGFLKGWIEKNCN